MSQAINHTIGVLLAGSNQMTSMLTSARHNLKEFQSSAESAALAINNIRPKNIDMSAIEQASQTLKNTGTNLLKGGLAIGGVLAGGVYESARLQSSLKNLGSVSTIPLDGSIKDLKDGLEKSKAVAREWSSNHRQAANLVTDAMYDLASAGLNMTAVNSVTNQTMATAAATNGTAAVASSVMSKELKTFGDTQLATLPIVEKANIIMDTYAAVVKGAKTTLPDLASGMKAVRGQASNMGLTLQETAAMVGLLQTRGLEAATSGTYFSGILRQLPKAAKELGLTIADNNGRLLPMANIIDQLTARYAENGISVKEGAEIQRLFGDEASKAIQLLIGQGDALRDLTAAASVSGTAMSMVAIQEDSLSAQAQILWNNVKNLAGIMGDSLTPILSVAADATGWLVKQMSSFAEAHPAITAMISVTAMLSAGVLLVGGIALIAAGQIIQAMALVGPYLSTIGGWVNSAIASISSTVTWALSSLSLATIQTKLSAISAMITSKITFASIAAAHKTALLTMKGGLLSMIVQGKILGATNIGLSGTYGVLRVAMTAVKIGAKSMWAAIAGPFAPLLLMIPIAIEGFILLYKSITTSGGLLNGVWQDIKAGFSGFVDTVLYGAGFVVGAVKSLYSIVEPVIGTIGLMLKAFATVYLTPFVVAFNFAWGVIKTGVIFIWDVIKAVFSNGFMAIYHIVAGLFTVIRGVFDIFVNLITGNWSGAWDAFVNMGSGILDHLLGIGGAIIGFFEDIGNSLFKAGAGLINAFIDGIKAGWEHFKGGFVSIWETIRSYMPHSDADQGPLSDLTKSGAAMLPTFAKGMRKTAQSPVEVAEQAMGQAAQILQFPAVNNIVKPNFNPAGELVDFATMANRAEPRSAQGSNKQPSIVVNLTINYNGTGSSEDAENLAETIADTLTEKLDNILIQAGVVNG